MKEKGDTHGKIAVVVIEDGEENRTRFTCDSFNGFEEVVVCKRIPPAEKLHGEWVLLAGSGERLSPALKDYLDSGKYISRTCSWVAVRFSLMEHPVHNVAPAYQPRLMRKEHLGLLSAQQGKSGWIVSFHSPTPLEKVLLDKKLYLSLDYNLQTCIRQIERVAQEKANDSQARPPSFWKACLFAPFSCSLQYLIFQRGFLDGKAGLMWAVLGIYQKIYEYMAFRERKIDH